MAAIELDPTKMNRLAFIRLLYLQAADSSNRSGPLSAASVLTFHDIIELFLILAAEHRNAPALSRDGAFLDYWRILRPQRGYEGVELSGHIAMGRMHSVRNSFKHAGRLPTRDEVEDARSNVRRFLEDNTPKVFGIEFDDISVADVVPHIAARERLKAATVAEAGGNRSDAMALLASAFTGVFYPSGRSGVDDSRFSFGRTVNPWMENEEEPTEEEKDQDEEEEEEPGESQGADSDTRDNEAMDKLHGHSKIIM
jgi:hypothetical protein